MKTMSLIPLIAILCVVILAPCHACAQLNGFGTGDATAYTHKPAYPNSMTTAYKQEKKDHFTIFYWNMGLFIFTKTKGKFTIGFPYERRDSSEHITQQNYTSDREDPFSKNAVMIDLINVAHSSIKNFYTVGAGLVPNYDGYYIDMGYGYNFYAPRFNGDIRNNSFILRPSFSLCYFNVSKKFDNIYNNQQDLKILGYYAYSHYVIHPLGGDYTETSEYVKVKFIQATISAVPGITISSNPFRKKFNYGLTCSWFIPAISKSGLLLIQKATDHNGEALNNDYSNIPLHHTDVTATLDDKKLTKSPYSFGGFYAGINFGVRLK